jgi:hypothetical protein
MFVAVEGFHFRGVYFSLVFVFCSLSGLFRPISATIQIVAPTAKDNTIPSGWFMNSMLSKNIHTLRNTGMDPKIKAAFQKIK